MPIKILATGDIHIGRRPTKLPDDSAAEKASCAAMWQAIVERAIEEDVDLVALSGDIVHHVKHYYEALGALERGLKRLAENQIHTYAVAGNHDFDVLPRLIDLVGSDYFHLLGRGGRWEETTFSIDGQPKLNIVGWSFSARHVETSPLADFSLAANNDLPVLGLLHADLDAPDSQYAPIRRDELESQNVLLWVLGHIHKPKLTKSAAGASWLYPGSPQAMDPGETGLHGPWMIEIHSSRKFTATQAPMSRVRYEALAISLDAVTNNDEFDALLLEETEQVVAGAAESSALDYLLLRLTATGHTELCGQIDQLAPTLIEEFYREANGATLRIEKMINQTSPRIDLEELAKKHDPPGVVARLLIQLRGDDLDDELQGLIQSAQERMASAHRHKTYRHLLDDPKPDRAAARRSVITQAVRLLETLRSQEQGS